MPQGRILIVDDDAEWIEILSGLLAPFEEQGVLVDSASSRAEAQRKLDRQRFDLVTMDIQLDKGIEEEEVSTEEELKWELLLQKCQSKETRVIVVSAHPTTERVKIAFRDYDVDDFYEKQHLKRKEFIKAVKEVLQKSLLKTGETEEKMANLSHRAGGATVSDELRALRKRLGTHRRKLNKLEDKKAVYAKGEEPVHLLTQIDDAKEEIARLEAELCEFEKEPDHADSD